MRILNFQWHTFSLIEEENFFVAYFNYIDYNWRTREVCITQQFIWRNAVYIAKYSWLTTEYTWTLKDVLIKVIEQYKKDEIEIK